MRAGDVITHIPSGETWVLAYAKNGKVSPCGWPESVAEESNCVMLKAATDEEYLNMLEIWAKKINSGDHRHSVCNAQLKEFLNGK